MGATQFRTPRANWDKRCCSNPRGPVVPIPQDLNVEDANKIDKQIARMPQMKEVKSFALCQKLLVNYRLQFSNCLEWIVVVYDLLAMWGIKILYPMAKW